MSIRSVHSRRTVPTPTLGMGVGPQRLRRGADDPHAGGGEDRVERRGDLRIPIALHVPQLVGFLAVVRTSIRSMYGELLYSPGLGLAVASAAAVDALRLDLNADGLEGQLVR